MYSEGIKMSNVIFTNAESYAQVHEAFRLDNLNAMAVEHGLQIYAHIVDGQTYPEYSNVTYGDNNNLTQHFADFCNVHKPQKIVNYIDYLTPWDITENIDAEKIWFVRSLYAEVMNKNPEQSEKTSWMLNEKEGIASADKVICASPTSQEAIKRHYNVDADMVLEYVNPAKFLEVTAPTSFAKEAYFTGRFDHQKRFDLINEQTGWNIIGIGGSALDTSEHTNISSHGYLTFEEYKDKISQSVFGLYPAVWESNGFGVQECLAMGKVPIIHTGSGGHERLCDNTNSISIDWTSDNWWEVAESSYNSDMHESAKNTLTVEMYEASRDKFLDVIL